MTRASSARLFAASLVLVLSAAACGDEGTSAPARRLLFTSQPAAAEWGVTFATQPVVAVVMGDEAIDTSTATVTLTLIGGGGAVLSDTTSVAADGGVVAFAGLSVVGPAAIARLVASAPGLVSDTSEDFTIGGPLPDHLVFITQPDSLTGGQTDSIPVTVEVRTAAGVLVPWYQGVATLTKAPGSPNGSMIGLLSDSVRNGTVNFLAIKIDTAGAGYRLVVNAAGLAADTTAPFTVHVGLMSIKSIWAIYGGPVVVVGDTVPFYLIPRDLGGNRVSLNVDSLMMHRVGGTSDGTFSPWEDTGVGAGPYYSLFTATTSGTPVRFLISQSGIPGPTTPGTLTVNP